MKCWQRGPLKPELPGRVETQGCGRLRRRAPGQVRPCPSSTDLARLLQGAGLCGSPYPGPSPGVPSEKWAGLMLAWAPGRPGCCRTGSQGEKGAPCGPRCPPLGGMLRWQGCHGSSWDRRSSLGSDHRGLLCVLPAPHAALGTWCPCWVLVAIWGARIHLCLFPRWGDQGMGV